MSRGKQSRWGNRCNGRVTRSRSALALCGLLGLAERPQLHLAHEGLRALRDDHGYGVSHVGWGECFRGILWTASGEFGGHASRADDTHANAMFTEIFRHTRRK